MQKIVFLLIAALLTNLWLVPAFAEKPAESDVRLQISSIFPRFEVDSVAETPVPGLYEIVSKDGQIIYWSPSGYFVFGEIVSKTGVSVTAERRQEIMAKRIREIDLSKAIKVGDGKIKVITFSDPDCPFCQKGFEFFSKRTDVTEYLFLLPFHVKSFDKIAYILCSDNKEKAYKEVMKAPNKEVSVTQECKSKAEPIVKEFVSISQSLGVRGTPTYFIDGKVISGANIPLLENMLTNMSKKVQ